MSEYHSVALNAGVYKWVGEFRNSLRDNLGRPVPMYEAIAILAGVAAKGNSPEKLAQSVAKEYRGVK